jgi:hypothetical protein
MAAPTGSRHGSRHLQHRSVQWMSESCHGPGDTSIFRQWKAPGSLNIDVATALSISDALVSCDKYSSARPPEAELCLRKPRQGIKMATYVFMDSVCKGCGHVLGGAYEQQGKGFWPAVGVGEQRSDSLLFEGRGKEDTRKGRGFTEKAEPRIKGGASGRKSVEVFTHFILKIPKAGSSSWVTCPRIRPETRMWVQLAECTVDVSSSNYNETLGGKQGYEFKQFIWQVGPGGVRQGMETWKLRSTSRFPESCHACH